MIGKRLDSEGRVLRPRIFISKNLWKNLEVTKKKEHREESNVHYTEGKDRSYNPVQSS